MNLCCTHLSVSPLYFPRLHQQWIIAMLSLQKFGMKSKDVTFKFALHLSLVRSLTNCSQMLLVERVWSRIKICLENHQRAISRSIWNPSQQFWFSFSSCVIYIERIAAELRAAQKEIQEKIITLWTSSAGLPFVFFFICILRCALDVRYRKVPLSQIVWGCFCPLESWFRSEANSHFKRRECCTSRSIQVLAKPASSSYEAGCWLLWSSHWTVIVHARCTIGDVENVV